MNDQSDEIMVRANLPLRKKKKKMKRVYIHIIVKKVFPTVQLETA
jgi:hypothetical protein